MTYTTPDWISVVRDAAIVIGFLIAVAGAVVAVGALNKKASTSGLDLRAVMNKLAGTSGLTATRAANVWAGIS